MSLDIKGKFIRCSICQEYSIRVSDPEFCTNKDCVANYQTPIKEEVFHQDNLKFEMGKSIKIS